MTEAPIHPATVIGHVHLKVSDLARAVQFYTEVMGFELMTRMGDSAAFLSAGGYHHHLGLNTWESRGGRTPAPGTTGLYHFAILLPNRLELARTFKRIVDHGWPIGGGRIARGIGPEGLQFSTLTIVHTATRASPGRRSARRRTMDS